MALKELWEFPHQDTLHGVSGQAQILPCRQIFPVRECFKETMTHEVDRTIFSHNVISYAKEFGFVEAKIGLITPSMELQRLTRASLLLFS